MSNLAAMESGTNKRDPANKDMEIKFSRLLGDVELMALLIDHKALSRTIQQYMFGWFAQKIQPQLTYAERNNVYWEVAVRFLDQMKQAADDFEKKDTGQRTEYWRKRHFSH